MKRHIFSALAVVSFAVAMTFGGVALASPHARALPANSGPYSVCAIASPQQHLNPGSNNFYEFTATGAGWAHVYGATFDTSAGSNSIVYILGTSAFVTFTEYLVQADDVGTAGYGYYTLFVNC